MKGFFAIVIREIIDRRAILIAAAVAALIPVLIPFAPGLSSSSASDIREVTAFGMGIGLGWIFAMFLGSSMVGGDLAQGRFGFYFSRPVGGGAIWFGKLSANLLLVLATEVIVLLPAVVLAGSGASFAFPVSGSYIDFGPDDPLWMLVGLLVGLPLLLLVVSHAIGVMWRARSAWVAVDVVVGVVLVAWLWFQLASLMMEAPLASLAVAVFLVLCLIVVLILAGAAQVSIGRTDVQRGHRTLSTVLWGGLLTVSAIATGYCAWVTGVEPGDLLTVETVRSAPQGPWIEVVGSAAGRFDFIPRFLYNRETEAYLRLFSSSDWGDQVAFSLDGTRAAWLAPVGFLQRQLVFADLGESRPRPRETPLTMGMAGKIRLSERGDRVAIFEESILSIYETETGELLVASRRETGRDLRLARFMSDDIFRVVSGTDWSSNVSPGPTRIQEIDVETGDVETTGTVGPDLSLVGEAETWIWRSRFAYDRGRDRIWMIEGVSGQWHMTIRDGRTGEIEVDLGVSPVYSRALWSGDGRLVRESVENAQGWIEIVSPEETEGSRISVGPADRLIFGGESIPGEVSFAVEPLGDKNRVRDCIGYSININTGVVRRVPGAVYPVSGWWGEPDGKLWFNKDWALLHWDPVAGTTEHLLGTQGKGGHEPQ